MPLLIDTYNVLHTVGVLPPHLAGVDVQSLAQLLESSRYATERVTLACDGEPPTGPIERNSSTSNRASNPVSKSGSTIILRYSGHGRSADDLIAQLIRASTAPRRLTVVSSDHAVLRAARRRRCKLLTAQEFLQQLADDAQIRAGGTVLSGVSRPSGISDAQVDRWIKLFKLDAKTLALPPRTAAGIDTAHQDNAVAKGSKALTPDTPATIAQPVELPPGPMLPQDVIEQAEQLWNEQSKVRRTEDHDRSG